MSDVVKRLPLEVLDKIIGHLEYLEDERNAALVNKTWYRVAQRYIYETIYLDHEDDAVLFFETIHFHKPSVTRHVQSLRIKTCGIARITLRRLLQCSWPKLERLVLPTSGHDILQSVDGMSILPQLLELQLESSKIDSRRSSSDPDPDDLISIMQSIPPRFPKLQKLRLNCMDVGDTAPVGLLSFFRATSPHIKSLSVHRGYAWSNTEHTEISKYDTEMLDLLQHVAGQLDSLELFDREKTFDLPLFACIRDLPKLKSLRLSIDGQFVHPLIFPATVQQLDVSCYSIPAEHLLAFWLGIKQGHTLPHLKYIPMIVCPNWTGESGSRARCKEAWLEAEAALASRGVKLVRPFGRTRSP